MGLLELIGGVAIFLLMLLTVSDALLRSFANSPILGANDLTQVLLVVVVACSLPLCIVSGRAIAVEFVISLLPAALRKLLGRLSALGGSLILGYLAWRCFLNSREAAAFGETTMLLQIPFGPFYLILSVGLAFSAILFLIMALRTRGAS